MKPLALITTALITIAVLAAGMAPGHAQDARRAPPLEAKRALAMVDTGGAVGTAFAVSATAALTACHVVRGAAAIQLHFWAADRRLPGRLVLCNERHDVALIAVAVPDGTTTLPLSDAHPAPGDRVWVWGYPLATRISPEPSLSQGVVSARGATAGTVALDVSAGPGSSGGPVLNDEGQVVGILLGGWHAGSGAPTGFTHAVLAGVVRSLIAGVEPPSGSVPAAASTTSLREIGIRPGEGIGPLRLGMTAAEVRAAIGVPPTRRYESGWVEWEARRLWVYFHNGRAVMIDTDDPSLGTAEGIKVGSTDSDLIKVYGMPACSSVREFRGRAYLGWYYGGLFVFLNGSPRQVFGLRVLPAEAAQAVCRP
ncbi:MAG TPA: serine protease [bacterium]|nr:serine protease [bacterium]